MTVDKALGSPVAPIALVKAIGDDTEFTSPPPAKQRIPPTVFGPLWRLLGFRTSNTEYEDDRVWETRVEQPAVR